MGWDKHTELNHWTIRVGVVFIILSIIAPLGTVVYLWKQNIIRNSVRNLLIVMTFADLLLAILWTFFPGDGKSIFSHENTFWMYYWSEGGPIFGFYVTGLVDTLLFTFVSLAGTAFSLVGFYISRLSGAASHITATRISALCFALTLVFTAVLVSVQHDMMIYYQSVFFIMNLLLVVSANVLTLLTLRHSKSSKKADGATRLMMRIFNSMTVSNIISWIPVTLHTSIRTYQSYFSIKRDKSSTNETAFDFFMVLLQASLSVSLAGRGLIHSLAILYSIYPYQKFRMRRNANQQSVSVQSTLEPISPSKYDTSGSYETDDSRQLQGSYKPDLSKMPSAPSIHWDISHLGDIHDIADKKSTLENISELCSCEKTAKSSSIELDSELCSSCNTASRNWSAHMLSISSTNSISDADFKQSIP